MFKRIFEVITGRAKKPYIHNGVTWHLNTAYINY